MEPQTQASSKELVDFHVSYIIIHRDSTKSQFHQKPLKKVYEYVCESIDELVGTDDTEEVKDQDMEVEMKSDSPTFPSILQRRLYPLGDRIFKSSISGRCSPDVRSEGLLGSSTKYSSHGGGISSSASKPKVKRVPSINVSKPFSPEGTPIDTAPATTHMLSLKDLRKLDFQMSRSDRAPSILVRRHCMVVSFGFVRSILLADRAILLCPAPAAEEEGTSPSHITSFESYVKEWNSGNDEVALSASGIPFEQHILEGLLAMVKASEEQEYASLNTQLRASFHHYDTGSKKPAVETEVRFKNLKTALFDLRGRLAAYRVCLQEVMEDDEQMALMNLTYLVHRPHLYKYPFDREIMHRHEHVEDMLESDLLDFSNIHNNASHLENRVTNVEAMYHLHLNIVENMALRGDTFIMLLICSITFAAYIAGAFGMNLDNTSPSTGIEALYGGFSIVLVVSLVCVALFFYFLLLSVIWSKVFPYLSPWKF